MLTSVIVPSSLTVTDSFPKPLIPFPNSAPAAYAVFNSLIDPDSVFIVPAFIFPVV